METDFGWPLCWIAAAALAAKYMPDLGFETIDSKVIHWSLKGWSQLPSRAVGQELSVGGYKWCVISKHTVDS